MKFLKIETYWSLSFVFLIYATNTFPIIERRYACGNGRQDFKVDSNNVGGDDYWRFDSVYFQKLNQPLEKQIGVLTEPLSFLD